MKTRMTQLMLVTATAALAGCPIDGLSRESPTRAQVAAIQSVFNSDLGDEGTPVTRSEISDILEGDPELLAIVLSELSGAEADAMDAEVDADGEAD